MSTPSMDLSGRNPAPRVAPPNKSLIPDPVKTALILALVLAVGYLLYDSYQYQQKSQAELAKISDRLGQLETHSKTGEAKLTNLIGEISETQQAVGSTKEALQKTAQQFQAEGQKTKRELSQALSSKADTSQVHEVQQAVQAARTEAESKIGQVNEAVGGVKKDVGTVRDDLASTKRDLEGTQRQLVDVRETLSAAVAKNAGELSELRRKGEKDYFEFEIPKKNQITKVEDIRLVLTKTDPKKGKFNVQILADDARLEKKDRTINEPVQFLVGRNRIRYELVVNWVQKDRAGGYLSIPKDKTLASEHAK